MSREEFIQQFVLSRTSHKKDIKILLAEAEEAYTFSTIRYHKVP